MTTTDQIRRAVSASGWRDCGGAEGFDAWLAEHDREVQARAWQQGAEDTARATLPGAGPLTNPYGRVS